MTNPLLTMIEERKNGKAAGIPSYCTANRLAIEACLDMAKKKGIPVLVEATSNQINQDGGYTGMQAEDYREYVYEIAKEVGIDRKQIILGADHMGPLPWADKPETEAMDKAEVLVRMCVKAGFTKVHLDTSMRLGDDSTTEALSTFTVARRGARLLAACEEEYAKLLENNPEAVHPVYIIGSEVPIPGGSQEEEDSVAVTKTEAFETTVKAYDEEFRKAGIKDAWKYVIAVVVQPGVEFGNQEIHFYDRENAKELMTALAGHEGLVFEGHSTDYQSAEKLREMVEDGVGILKVGPALTFAAREGLYALAMMEKYLVPDTEKQSHFIEILDKVMLDDPKNWKKYYFGDEARLAMERGYSLSDRSRYYIGGKEVQEAQDKLFENMENVDIPLGLLHQFMPLQYPKVRDGILSPDPKSLVKDNVICITDDYNFASGIE